MLLDGLLREGHGLRGELERRAASWLLSTCMTKRRGATVLDLRSMKEKMMRDCDSPATLMSARRAGVSGEHLADRLCDGEELHASVDAALGPLPDADDEEPLSIRARLVVDDLRALEVGMPVEHFLWRISRHPWTSGRRMWP